MNLMGGLNQTLIAAHIAATTNAVPSRRRRGTTGAWLAIAFVVALIAIAGLR